MKRSNHGDIILLYLHDQIEPKINIQILKREPIETEITT